MSAAIAAPRGASGGVPAPVRTPRAIIDYDFETVLKVPPKRRLVLWLMAALIGAGTAGLGIARVDVIVSANGRLASSAAEIVVQPLETSVVRSVDVKMGDTVKAGAVLAELDPTFTAADENELAAKLRNLQASFDRLSAETAGQVYAPVNPDADEQAQLEIWYKRQQEYAAQVNAAERKTAEYEADLAAHKIEAEGLSQQIQLAGEAQGIYQALVGSNLASKLKLIETTQNLVDAKARLATNLGAQEHLTHQIAESAASRDAFVSKWKRELAEELAKTRSERDEVAAQLSKARLRREMTVLRAPRDGIVLEVADRPAGAVVRAAEPMFRLVPANAPLEAEIRVDTRDVARLNVGDPVTVKFEALPWQQFGLAHGILKTLAPDTESDATPKEAAADMARPDLKQTAHESVIHYRAQVAFTDTQLRNLPSGFALRPGMRVVADIKVGRRSVLEYILNPVTRVITESLREP